MDNNFVQANFLERQKEILRSMTDLTPGFATIHQTQRHNETSKPGLGFWECCATMRSGESPCLQGITSWKRSREVVPDNDRCYGNTQESESFEPFVIFVFLRISRTFFVNSRACLKKHLANTIASSSSLSSLVVAAMFNFIIIIIIVSISQTNNHHNKHYYHRREFLLLSDKVQELLNLNC